MGILRVTVIERKRLVANEVRLYVALEGDSFALGRAALEKAREVRSFVARFREEGLDAKQLTIEAQGMRLKNSTGLLQGPNGKAHKADFQLMLCSDPAKLAKILQIISNQNNVRLKSFEWYFDDFEASISVAASAMKKARRKANAIAKAAEHVVLGVHHAVDCWQRPSKRVFIDQFDQIEANSKATSKGSSWPNGSQERSYGRDSRPKPLALGSLDVVGIEYSTVQEIQVELTVDFVIE